jgi:hypothetical protein
LFTISSFTKNSEEGRPAGPPGFDRSMTLTVGQQPPGPSGEPRSTLDLNMVILEQSRFHGRNSAASGQCVVCQPHPASTRRYSGREDGDLVGSSIATSPQFPAFLIHIGRQTADIFLVFFAFRFDFIGPSITMSMICSSQPTCHLK